MGKINDALKVMTGRDLEDEAPKKVGKKSETKAKAETKAEEKAEKVESKAKEPERKPVATDEAKFAAFRYANKAEQLSEDVQEALEKGSLTPELEKLLQVLFDSAAVRELVSAQGGVRAPKTEPEAEKYHLSFSFKNATTGDDCTKAAENLLSSGTSLDQLETFNMKLYVSRVRDDDTEICEGDESDYLEIRTRLTELTEDDKDEDTEDK